MLIGDFLDILRSSFLSTLKRCFYGKKYFVFTYRPGTENLSNALEDVFFSLEKHLVEMELHFDVFPNRQLQHLLEESYQILKTCEEVGLLEQAASHRKTQGLWIVGMLPR